MLSQAEFDVLVYLEKHQDFKITQRKLSEVLEISLGLANKGINKLLENDYISIQTKGVYSITKLGYSLLDDYKVKRAIFFAAGFGERLLPITKNKAKALIEIDGKRIIDRLLDALIENEITEIYIVRGYLGHQFDELLIDYPMIQFVDSDTYATSKNITSAYLVRDFFENSYIIEADTILNNPKVIQKYEFESHYKTVKVKRSDSWSFKVQGKKIIKYN